MSLSTKKRISNWVLDGAWSLGLATVLSSGVISPLTLCMSAAFFAVQAKGGYPIAKIARSVVKKCTHFYDDYIDPNHNPDSDDDSLDSEEEELENENTAPINDGIDTELLETNPESYTAVTGWKKHIPGMTWLFEKAVRYQLPNMSQAEVDNTPEGLTRLAAKRLAAGENVRAFKPHLN